MKVRVALFDTSALMLYLEGIDVIEQVEKMGLKCAILDKVFEELKKLSEEPGKKGKAARLALDIVRSKCITMKYQGRKKHTDDAIVETAIKMRIPVVTADMELRRRLLRRVPTIYYRESQRRFMSDDYFDL